jgi:hypothetical protein
MMQAGRARGPDVHGGPLPHRLEALEYLDLVSAVVVDRAVAVTVRVGRRRGIALEESFGLVLLFRMFQMSRPYWSADPCAARTAPSSRRA